MKPLTHCPGCQVKLTNGTGASGFIIDICSVPECSMYYAQACNSDNIITMFTFNLKKFKVIVGYGLNNRYGIEVSIESKWSEGLREYYEPLFEMPLFDIDPNNQQQLDELYNRFKKLVVFS